MAKSLQEYIDESKKLLHLTSKQKTEIHDYIMKTSWPFINDNLLTEEQRNNPKAMKNIAFDMEEIFRAISATFGLCGLI